MPTPALSRRAFQCSLVALAAAGLLPLAAQAQAQAFPAKPVRLVVTYPPGGSSDLMGRLMAQKLGELWKQQVLVESKPGAAGALGMEFTARQPADGYTMVLGNLGPAGVNPIITKLPYSMEKDFIAVALTATAATILCVPATSPFRTLADLVAAAKAAPDTISFGTSDAGSMAHLAAELLMRQAQIQPVNVPFKGGGQSVNDLLGGQLGFMIADALPVAQFIRTQKLRALVITSATRSPLFPDIPTFAEASVQGLAAVDWWGTTCSPARPRPWSTSTRRAWPR